jgi:hypothetical protein
VTILSPNSGVREIKSFRECAVNKEKHEEKHQHLVMVALQSELRSAP